MPVVTIPNVGNVEFPESMDAEAIGKAAADLYSKASKATTTTASSPLGPPASLAPLAPTPEEPKRPSFAENVKSTALRIAAGGPALDVLPESVKGAFRSVGEQAGKLSHYSGNIALALADDIASGAITRGAPRTVEAFNATPKERPEPQGLPSQIAESVVRGAGEMAPALAAGYAGVPMPIAFGTQMGLQTYGETGDASHAARQAAVGFLLGKAGEAGAAAGEAAGLRLASALPQGIENAAIEASKFTGQQVALNALMTAGNTPELIEQWRADPKAAASSLAQQIGANLAFAAPQFPAHLRNATAKNMADAFVQSPEYKAWLDHTVRIQGVPEAAQQRLPDLTPETTSALRTTTPKLKEPNASEIPETAAVYGNVRSQPGQSQGALPIEEGGGGVQPQAEGGLSTPTPSGSREIESVALRAAAQANAQQGLPSSVIVSEEPGEKGVISYPDADGNIVVQGAEFRKWLASVPINRQMEAIRSLISEEGIHAVGRQVITDKAFANLWTSLSDTERNLMRRSYTGGDTADFSDAQLGQEYVRREMQRLLRTPLREISEASGFRRISDQVIDVIERIILAVRRKIGTSPSRELDRMLNKISAQLSDAKEFNKVPEAAGEEPLAYRRKLKAEDAFGQEAFYLPPVEGATMPQERPGASEAGALPPKPPTPEIVSKAAGEALASGSFESFAAAMKQYGVSPGQLREHWEDAVWRKAEAELTTKRRQPEVRYGPSPKEALLKQADELQRQASVIEGSKQKSPEELQRRGLLSLQVPEAEAQRSRHEVAEAHRKEAEKLRREAETASSEPQRLPEKRDFTKAYVPGEARPEARIASEALRLIDQAKAEKGKTISRRTVTPEDVRVSDPNAVRERSEFNINDPDLPRTLTEGGGADRTSKVRSLVSEGVARTIKRKAEPASHTKRLTALLDTKTGKVQLLSTYADKGNYRIVDPMKVHLPDRPNSPISEVLKDRRFRPIASFLLDEPVKNFRQVFDSEAEFNSKFGDPVRELHKEATKVEAAPAEEGVVGTPIFGTGTPMTDTEAGAFLDFAHDILGRIESRDDFNEIIPELNLLINQRGISPERIKETQRARLVAVALEKAVRRVEDENPNLVNSDETVSKALDSLYEIAQQAPTRESFVQAALKIHGATEVNKPTRGPERISPTEPRPYLTEAENRRFRERIIAAKEEQKGLDAALAAHRARNAPEAFLRAPGKTVAETIADMINDVPFNFLAATRTLAGKSAPRTSLLNEDAGNALIRFAGSTIAAPEIARSMTSQVLGERWDDTDFRNRFGAVLVEDRLRAIRQGFQNAGDMLSAAAVNTVVGKDWSPFSTDAEYEAALNDPEIQAAVKRHKMIVQPPAEEMHRQVGGNVRFVEDTGEYELLPSTVSGPGLQTGAFVNLEAIREGIEPQRMVGGAPRGGLENPLRRKSRFSRQARGTAEEYETDYRRLAQRMIEGNYEEFTKKQLYDNLVDSGLAVITGPLQEGEAAPTINGRKTTRFTIERRGAPAGEYAARTFKRYLWIREDLAHELRQAENVDGQIRSAGWVKAAQVLNQIQLAGPTDAVWHTANIVASIAGSQGGRNLLIDVVRKLPGVNYADALTRITASAIRVMRDAPDVQAQLAELAEMGALRSKHPKGFVAPFIALLDRAGRLVRDDMYMNLVDRGLTNYSEAGRREWNNQVGTYNNRLMSKFQQFFKDAGFSPFVIAGRNFNRMAIRRIFMDPGVKAASPKAWLTMRSVEALGMMATLIAVPALFNYIITGSASGRKGVKQGQIDTGLDAKDGSAIVIDPAQWTGLRRGLRITGLDSLQANLSKGASTKRITHDMMRDAIGGALHPWTGPALQFASVGYTGYSAQGYQESVNPYDYEQNVKAATEQLNPVARAFFAGKKTGRNPIAEGVLSLGGAAGIKEAKPFTAVQEVGNLLQDFRRSRGENVRERSFEYDDEPSYVNLRAAVRANNKDRAQEIYAGMLKTKTEDDIARAIERYATRPISGSADKEQEFIDWLGPKEGVYQQAKDEREALVEKIKTVLNLSGGTTTTSRRRR